MMSSSRRGCATRHSASSTVGHPEAERGAESPRIERGTAPHHRIAPPAEAPERVGHEVALCLDLRAVRERGKVTSATAVRDVAAPRCDAVGRRLDDAPDGAPVGPMAPADRHLDELTGERVVDEHDPPVVPAGQCGTARDQPLGPDDLHPPEA
jgi:hypothetical protein